MEDFNYTCKWSIATGSRGHRFQRIYCLHGQYQKNKGQTKRPNDKKVKRNLLNVKGKIRRKAFEMKG